MEFDFRGLSSTNRNGQVALDLIRSDFGACWMADLPAEDVLWTQFGNVLREGRPFPDKPHRRDLHWTDAKGDRHEAEAMHEIPGLLENAALFERHFGMPFVITCPTGDKWEAEGLFEKLNELAGGGLAFELLPDPYKWHADGDFCALIQRKGFNHKGKEISTWELEMPKSRDEAFPVIPPPRMWSVLQQYNSALFKDNDQASRMLPEIFDSPGVDTVVRPPVMVDCPRRVRLGNYVFVNSGCTFLASDRIEIEDEVMIGPNVQLITATHPTNYEQRTKGILMHAPIFIGKGAWLGAGVIVLPGITIGARSVVGAGSVVTEDVPADVVVAGNPAKIIKYL